MLHASALFTRADPEVAVPDDVRLMNAGATLLAAGAAALLAAAFLVWASHRPVFALKTIRIDGDLTHNSALSIRANAEPRLAGTFFTIDLDEGRRAFEAVPWVRRAVVRRVWPNRLAVQLEEHRAAALWESADARDEADHLVNTQCEVFEANHGDVEDESLPTLRGPATSSAHVLAMLRRLAPIFAGIEARIDALELSGRGSWRAELGDAAVIEMGRGSDDDVVERTRSFVATLPQVRARYPDRALLHADLRHRDGYAVRLEGVSTSAETTAPGAARH